VWLDALTNYITNIGYDPDGSSDEFNRFWPCDLHLIGKDIIRFHTIYWPCFLMSLDLPLPKKVFGHPWLIMADGKMSKSKGNVIYADSLVNEFGVDAIRYYLLHEIPFSSDGVFSYELLIERINGDLVNILGNLVNRTISMGHKYFNGNITNAKVIEDVDISLINSVNDIDAKIDEKMNNLEIGAAIDVVFDVLRKCNKYIDDTTPWILAKDEDKRKRLETVLYNLLEAIRVCTVYLKPYLPDTSDNIFKQLNNSDESIKFNSDNNYELGDAFILFQRIDVSEKLQKLNNN
jgi:methionyl-tRNA synthetase